MAIVNLKIHSPGRKGPLLYAAEVKEPGQHGTGTADGAYPAYGRNVSAAA